MSPSHSTDKNRLNHGRYDREPISSASFCITRGISRLIRQPRVGSNGRESTRIG